MGGPAVDPCTTPTRLASLATLPTRGRVGPSLPLAPIHFIVNGMVKESFMKIEMSTKARERLLYLISPIGLIIIWQVLLMTGIGDRRFIPAPSDIAQRFVKLAGSGELEWHVAVTLYRVVLGYIIGAVPAVAVGLLMAMFRPVRIFVDPLIAALCFRSRRSR